MPSLSPNQPRAVYAAMAAMKRALSPCPGLEKPACKDTGYYYGYTEHSQPQPQRITPGEKARRYDCTQISKSLYDRSNHNWITGQTDLGDSDMTTYFTPEGVPYQCPEMDAAFAIYRNPQFQTGTTYYSPDGSFMEDVHNAYSEYAHHIWVPR